MSGTGSLSATAFAPATVGNAAVGFDILGFALASPGDRVTVERIEEPEVRIGEITGVVTDLPGAPKENTATVGLLQMIDDLELGHGFRVTIDKGIYLGSGMGGSAASAVAAALAADAVVDRKLSREELLRYALLGESAATGSLHADNVTPCLFGGLTMTRSIEPIDVATIPVPDEIRCALVYPHRRLDTRRAREVIPDQFELETVIEQSANLAGFVTGCHQGDLGLIGRSLRDVMIEPHRASLIPGFSSVYSAAMEVGALGCSISGAGPSVFAWASAEAVDSVGTAMAEAFRAAGSETSVWTGPVSRRGAHVIENSDSQDSENRR